jgi:hypothetical protein
MPKYRITGPDGATYEVTAPDGASEQDVMEFVRSQASSEPVPPPKQPEMSVGEVAADVGKSAGIGLVQGGIGLATLPGNIEALGRAGINAAAGMVGARPPVASETVLPTYSDWKGRVENRTGKFYEPKTTLGQYARTGGEFASLALGGPAGFANRAARVALPAITSETAGQMTDGTALEPWARMGGAVLGGRLMNTGARTVTPAPTNPARANAVQTLENEGVTALTAGQRTGNERLRWVEDATAMVPGGGGRATAMQQQANEQFTRAALRRAGVNADRATPDVIDTAFQNIGREYQNFAHATNVVGHPVAARRFQAIANDYIANTSNAMRIDRVADFANELGNRLGGAGITGRQYNNYRSELARFQREQRSNPQASQAVGNMIQALDAAMLRSLAPAQRPVVRAALQDRNRRYRNLLAIEDAVAFAPSTGAYAATPGILTPTALKNAIRKNDKKGYTRNRNDMAPLARAGVEAITPLRSSGTAERNFAQNVVGAPSTTVGALAGGFYGGGDPVTMLAGAVAPALIKAATARGLMSGPMQRYFGNQRIPHNVEPVPYPWMAPVAAQQFDSALRGGIGPRYDEYGNPIGGLLGGQ